MSELPKVSVLLPTYNTANFLGRAIDSVLNQTFQSFELLILDDGSTDSSAAIIADFQKSDPRVKPIQLNHGGIVKALNAGIDTAKGEYIARMDADDQMSPDRLEKQYDYCSKHPKVVLGTNASLCDPKLRELGKLNPPATHKEILADCLAGLASSLMHPTMMASKNTLIEIGKYRETYRHIEDLDLYLRAAINGCTLFNLTDTVGLKYRLHANSISNSKADLQMQLKKKLLSELEEDGAITPDWDRLNRADQNLPRSRQEFYRKWGYIGCTNGRNALGYGYLLKSIFTPPMTVKNTSDALKLFKLLIKGNKS